jgi:hypothetical protein
MARFESPSAWTPLRVQQQIDPVLLDDKRLEISNEMQPKSLAARNSAKNDYQWAMAELILVNEWAEKLFDAWLEIWDTQGFPRCHALYRAIFESELRTLFATRNGCFKGQLNRRTLIHRSRANNSAIGRWFAREIDRLTAKWNRRVNAESRKAMYSALREARRESAPPTSQPKPEIQSPLQRAGRKRKRPLEFQRLAANLWRTNQGPRGTVDQEGLKRIASQLDQSIFSKPADYLEEKAASELKAHNQKYANSPKKIMSWTDLVCKGNPSQKAAMKKLLSRCASSIRK